MENNPRGFFTRLYIAALVCLIIVIAVSMSMIGPDMPFIAGAVAGCLLAVYKAAYWWNLPVKLAFGENKRQAASLLLNIFVQLLTGVALLVSVLVNTRLFYGMAAGMLGTIAGTVITTVIFNTSSHKKE